MNFRHQLKKAGLYKNSVKIDHVYMFTPEVLKDFIESASFEIMHFDSDEYSPKKNIPGIPKIHIRIVGKKLDKKSFNKLILTKNNFRNTLRSINKYIIYFKYLVFTRLKLFGLK